MGGLHEQLCLVACVLLLASNLEVVLNVNDIRLFFRTGDLLTRCCFGELRSEAHNSTVMVLITSEFETIYTNLLRHKPIQLTYDQMTYEPALSICTSEMQQASIRTTMATEIKGATRNSESSDKFHM